MHTASYEFLMKPKESARCHQTLSTRVGSGDETSIYEECVSKYGNKTEAHDTAIYMGLPLMKFSCCCVHTTIDTSAT